MAGISRPGISRREFAVGAAGTALLAGCLTSPETNASPHLFYLGGQKVLTVDPAGGAPRAIVDESPKDGSRGPGLNDGIAIHSRTRQVYWSNMGKAADNDGWIKRANLDGSNVTTIVPPGGAFTPKQIKIDEVAAKIYWSDREGMAIRRCNLDGSSIETLVTTGDPVADKGNEARWCVGIALDPARGQIYWTQKGGDNAGQGVIRRCRIPTQAEISAARIPYVETLFWRLPEPIDLDLDLATRTMYWTDRGDNTLSRATMDAPEELDLATRSDRTILLRDIGEAIGVALDLPRNRMAYTSLGGDVGIASLDGSNAKMLATGQGALTGICWA